MTIRTSSQALAQATAQTRNTPGTCQLNTRLWFNAPSAGDQDGDGDADAVDGWKSEPLSKRHPGDRNPPSGKPLAWKGGSKGYGHRALSAVNGLISTDMYGNRYRAGFTSKVKATSTAEAIAIVERSMGVEYLGWSETIDGEPIPPEPAPRPIPGPKRAPSSWSDFKHLDSSEYMNYYQALLHLSLGDALDIDAQKDKEGVGWGLHWMTVGKNHLHDPKKLIRSTRRIDSLTSAEVARLRGPKGQVPRRIGTLLKLANKRKVRIELEAKCLFSDAWVRKLMALPEVKAMNRAGRLQVKVLAAMTNPIGRLTPFQKFGATTILSFTKYTGAGIPKTAWPVIDYYRGTAKWR